MNLAVFKKGSNEIKYFIMDCIQTGNDYTGANIKLAGLKSKHWDFMWTNDIAIRGKDKKWSKSKLDLIPTPVFFNKSVGDIEDVNNVVKAEIKKKYSIEEEIKILRLKLAGLDDEFPDYFDYVEDLRSQGKIFKYDNFNNHAAIKKDIK